MKLRIFAVGALLTIACVITGCGGSSAASGASDAAAKSGCKPLHHFTTVDEGSLTFALTQYAPAAYMDGGKFTGIEGDLLQKVAAWECLKLKVVMASQAAVIPELQTGRADLTGGDLYRTTARGKVVNQSLPLYLDSMVLVSKDGAVRTISQLLHEAVGTENGALWDADLDKLLGSRLKTYEAFPQAYQDLADGRISAVVDGALGERSDQAHPKSEGCRPAPGVGRGGVRGPGAGRLADQQEQSSPGSSAERRHLTSAQGRPDRCRTEEVRHQHCPRKHGAADRALSSIGLVSTRRHIRRRPIRFDG